MSARARRAEVLLLVLLAAACAEDEPPPRWWLAEGPAREMLAAEHLTLSDEARLPERAIELAELFRLTAGRETSALEFGTEEAGRALGEGWSFPEHDGTAGFVWATGERSLVEWSVAVPRELRLVLRGAPFAYEGAPPQEVELRWNGAPLVRFVMPAGTTDHQLTVPEERVRPGVNVLELAHAWSRPPKDVIPGAEDARPLASRWFSIRLAEEQAAPRLEGVDGRAALFLPWRGEVELFPRLEPGSVLLLPESSTWPRASAALGHLEIALQLAGEELEHVLTLPIPRRGAGPRALRLPVERGGPARLALRAVEDRRPERADAGCLLIEPAVRLPAARELAASPSLDALPSRPNVIVYLVDTLRADHLGCYGYERPTSPGIDAFARDATLFRAAYAQAPWTRPAIASLMTGLHSQEHGVVEREHSLPAELPLLAELLRAAGYRTDGVTVNGNVAAEFGFARGFDDYRLLAATDATEVTAQSDAVNDAAFELLDEAQADGRPFFLWLHTADPHDPYTPREPYRQRFAPEVEDRTRGSMGEVRSLRTAMSAPEQQLRDLVDLYDAEIAFNDASFAALLAKLRELGLYDSSVILFLSDHGESFLEHGRIGHGWSLHQPEIHIPFILRLPGGVGSGRAIERTARQIDVLPTLLDLLRLPEPARLPGRSLLPLVLGEPASGPGSVPSYAYSRLDGVELEGVVADGRKLIRTWKDPLPGPRLQLYDLGTDPRELSDLAERERVWLGSHRSALEAARRLWERRAEVQRVEPSGELERQLRALGYF